MAVSYSLAVTLTYFSVYCLMFLFVSGVCAYKIYKETNKGKSKGKLFMEWIKLTWQKKRVYLHLIPHFFDQATDFGVLIEYYQLRNQEIGIQTMYLFVVSLFILCLHRVISTAAIYQLTHNIRFSFLQFIDVLMIRCIWTNYVLGSEEPSNCQRYLQILEATFESAPQILISAAFLTKATSDASPIVLLSLITSLWSLSSRVSSDDKLMFSDEWKRSKVKGCPFINIRWIIRVFCWRFLEMSSRIVFLCLVWINLGGVSIFVILSVEFIYLSVLCYGLGTVHAIGNIMYLVAASSTKNKGWGIKMTYIFWIYRVISTWILLITVTVFANTGFDSVKIQDGATRHRQTIENNIGFALFIFCWIATPIWQCVGAVIVLDYKNLASVGRDVSVLSQDEKWWDVLELIEFGVDFEPEQTLTAIYTIKKANKKDVDVCKKIANQCLDTMNEKQIRWDEVFVRCCYHGKVAMAEFLLVNSSNDKKALSAPNNKIKIDDDGVEVQQMGMEMEIEEHADKQYDFALNVNLSDNNQQNALFYALAYGLIHKETTAKIVQLLLDMDVNVNQQDINGRTAFSYAAENGYLEIVKLLLMNGADVNITDDVNGHSALFFAVFNKQKSIVQYLVENENVNVSQTDAEGVTVFEYAADRLDNEMVDILIEGLYEFIIILDCIFVYQRVNIVGVSSQILRTRKDIKYLDANLRDHKEEFMRLVRDENEVWIATAAEIASFVFGEDANRFKKLPHVFIEELQEEVDNSEEMEIENNNQSAFNYRYDETKNKSLHLEWLKDDIAKHEWMDDFGEKPVLQTVKYILYLIRWVPIFVIAMCFTVSIDVAMLVINNVSDCNKIYMSISVGAIGINEFIFVGCVIHIIVWFMFEYVAVNGGLLSVMNHLTNRRYYWIVVYCFFIIWCVIGILCASKMNINTRPQQCSIMFWIWNMKLVIEVIGITVLSAKYSHYQKHKKYIKME